MYEDSTNLSSVGSQQRNHTLHQYNFGPQPQSKNELREWLEQYCDGVTEHGEPNTWDVTLVTDMTALFEELRHFNAPIDRWDTSNVTSMRYMFSGASAFNQALAFDTSQVEDMMYMFRDASAFNHPLAFDTSQVTDMENMFEGATAFNQPLNWDTSWVETMSSMFEGATAFNQLLEWDTANVKEMNSMFEGATAFNQPLEWDTSQVNDMENMFLNATAFNQPIVFDVAPWTDIASMFEGATAMTYPVPEQVDEDTTDEDEADPCEDKSRQLCVVCMTSCVDTVMVPCGHACMCHGCATRVKETTGKCPICRRKIENINTIIPKIYYTGIDRNNEEE